MSPNPDGVVVTLLRGPWVGALGSLNNEPTPPLGLALLAGSLTARGFDVRGLDATAEGIDRVARIPGTKLQYRGIGIDEIVARIDPATRIVGVSAMFSHEWTYNKKLITAVKKAFPDALIIAGGEHVTALAEYVLRDCPALDYCCLGEGEETMAEFCARVAGGADPRPVEGLAYLDGGTFVATPPRRRIKDVDEIPWPDWRAFPIEVYLDRHIGFGASFGRNMPILASRGCPYQCTFCSSPQMWTTRYSIRTPDSVIEEIEAYRRDYGITGVQFYDLTAIVRKDWVIEFCSKLIEKKIDIEWSLPSGTRSEALDDEALSLLAKANCRYLVYAPESGSSETLVKIKKRISLARMKDSIRAAISNGIVVRANMILGFPHETRRQILESLKLQFQFALMGVDECPLFPFQPYPGSEIFEYLRSKGRVVLKDDYFDSLATFSTGKFGIPDDAFCEHVGPRELHFYRVFGFIWFYVLAYLLYPKRILRTVRNLFSAGRSSTVFEQRLKDKLRLA